jgi:hypothetical protein
MYLEQAKHFTMKSYHNFIGHTFQMFMLLCYLLATISATSVAVKCVWVLLMQINAQVFDLLIYF